ncbi:MAG: HAD family phosphatase [Bacteroidetes bacterium]|nr:MAG: HAD family phosphatase [Bacteroidota bacterium]
MSAIQNIIFDFGNVLFDLNFSAVDRSLRQLLGDRLETAQEKLRASGVFHLYETGGLSTEEFVDVLRLATDLPLTAGQVVEAWNTIFDGMPRERFDILLRLRQRYQVFLLSNINELHADWIDAYMVREHGLRDFQSRYFDAVYYSHLIRLRKPDREIYEYVLADAEIRPEESVFIDDLEENVQAARELGIRGIVKTPEMDIMEVMEGWLKNG